MIALKEAKAVFAQFKKYDTDIELAEEIYRYVATNTDYIPYENENGYYRGHLLPFLHDVLVLTILMDFLTMILPTVMSDGFPFRMIWMCRHHL